MLLKKKIFSGVLSLSMIASLALPAGAMAAESDTTTTWSAPTQAMKVDDNIVKVGIHPAGCIRQQLQQIARSVSLELFL